MTEQVLNKPLSGEEIRQMIVNQVVKMLAGDIRLAGHHAFPACSFNVKIHLELAHSQLSPVDREISGGVGTMPAPQPDWPVTPVMDETVPEMPPNEARVENDLPVPVLTKDDKCRPVEKKVKYSRDKLRQTKAK